MPVGYNNTAKENERLVADEIASAWGVDAVRTTELFSPFDLLLYKHGYVVGRVEIKARSHAYGTFPSVFLAQRKYDFLSKSDVPAYFVVKFTDGTKAVNVKEIDPSNVSEQGRTDRQGFANDIEQIIDVPITLLKPLNEVPR